MIHLIGAGHVAEKIIKTVNHKVFLYDNNKNLQGTFLHGIEINPVEFLCNQENGKVIICTTSVQEIENQLYDLGISLEVELSDDVKEFKTQNDLLNFSGSFLITSGLPSNNLHGASGGCYKVDIEKQNLTVTRIIEGPCHGSFKDGKNIIITHQERGLLILDNTLNISHEIPLIDGCRPHGVVANESSYYVVGSNIDGIIVINKKTLSHEVINFSTKIDSYKSAQHHANDIAIDGNSVYVSMFSVSGNWKRGMFDGGIIEINLINKELIRTNFDAKLPHSVKLIDTNLVFLDSFNGDIISTGKLPHFSFNGFLRGIDYDETNLYITESRNRNTTGLIRTRFPTTIDSRINLIDRSSLFSTSFTLPAYISEIHSIIKL